METKATAQDSFEWRTGGGGEGGGAKRLNEKYKTNTKAKQISNKQNLYMLYGLGKGGGGRERQREREIGTERE